MKNGTRKMEDGGEVIIVLENERKQFEGKNLNVAKRPTENHQSIPARPTHKVIALNIT